MYQMDSRFTDVPPDTDEEAALALVRAEWGVDGAASKLGSERDDNFHIRAADGTEYLLKVSHPAEDRAVTALQTACLLHLASSLPSLPVPRVVLTTHGFSEIVAALPGQAPRTARLLSFLRGEPLHRARRTSEQRRQIGRTLAILDRGLATLDVPKPRFELIWDLARALQLRPLVAQIDDRERRALAAAALDDFETVALPRSGRLRRQIIHNDFNPHNLLIDREDPDVITGIIDFGDIVEAPAIYDVAVAAAYQILEDVPPLQSISELLSGYDGVARLEDVELDLLFDLIRTRLVLAVAITGFRAEAHPENRAYILRNNPASWRALERLAQIGRDEATARFRQACNRR